MNDTRPNSDRTRNSSDRSSDHGAEVMVADDRASLSPSQIVEQRLMAMLKHSFLPVSQVQRRVKNGPR